MTSIAIYSLSPNDFLSTIPWFLGLIIIPALIAYLSKGKVLYLFSIIISFIFLYNFIFYELNKEKNMTLSVYKDKNNLLFVLKENDKNVSLNNVILPCARFELKHIVERDKRISSFKSTYDSIYACNQEVISTRNSFNGFFLRKNDLQELYYKLK